MSDPKPFVSVSDLITLLQAAQAEGYGAFPVLLGGQPTTSVEHVVGEGVVLRSSTPDPSQPTSSIEQLVAALKAAGWSAGNVFIPEQCAEVWNPVAQQWTHVTATTDYAPGEELDHGGICPN